MSKVFRWTELEKEILLQAVNEADSVREGLQNAADVLGTTFYICRNYWYKNMHRKRLDQDKAFSDSVVTVREPEVLHSETDKDVSGLKESLEDFLGNVTNIVSENKRLAERNAYLERENKLLVKENQEIKEAYEYILKVIDRARKLTLEDENRPDKIKYAIKDGAVELVV